MPPPQDNVPVEEPAIMISVDDQKLKTEAAYCMNIQKLVNNFKL